MLTVIVSGLAIGAVYAAAALAYNVMYSTSKVLSVTTGHLCMLGGVFGAWFIAGLGLPIPVGLAGAIAVGALFGWITEIVGVRRVLARSDEHLWLLSTLALATMIQQAVGLWWGTEPKPFPRLIPQDFSAGLLDQKYWLPILVVILMAAGLELFYRLHSVGQAVPGHLGGCLRRSGARDPDRSSALAVLPSFRRGRRACRVHGGSADLRVFRARLEPDPQRLHSPRGRWSRQQPRRARRRRRRLGCFPPSRPTCSEASTSRRSQSAF